MDGCNCIWCDGAPISSSACPSCHGSKLRDGGNPGEFLDDCPDCKGTGRSQDQADALAMQYEMQLANGEPTLIEATGADVDFEPRY